MDVLTLITVFVAVLIWTLGYFVGKLEKGITIIHKKEEQKIEEGYNESMANELPQDIKNYYDKTDGFNRFE